MPENGPTETSPLLAGVVSPGEYLESGESAVGPLVGESHGNGTSKSGDEEAASTDDPDGARRSQYEGMPDVKKQLKYILPAVGIGIFMSAADQTIIASSYGKIGSDLQALNNTSWIATAYFLTLTSFQPLYGKLSDIFGRKACLMFAYAIFGIGCLLCGIARDINQLIAARAFAGIGGGGMTTVVSILMSDIVPLRERGTWQGIINIIFATGSSVGAPLGGILADSIGWRWAFTGQAPLCLAAFLATGFLLKLPKRDNAHWKAKLRRVDFPGAFVLVAAVTFLLLGLDQGSNVSWKSTLVIASLVVSVPLFGLFVLVEQKFAAEPFAPGRIVFERSLFAAYMCNFFAFGGWYGILFYVPLLFQAVDLVSAGRAGAALIPGIVGGVVGSLFGGFTMQKTGKYYWLTVSAYTLVLIGSVVVFLFSGAISNSEVGLSVGIAVGGFGNGIGVTSTLIALISNAAPEDQAIATACSYLFRSLGSVLGLSGLSAIAQQTLRGRLQDKLNSGHYAEGIVKKVRESLDFVKTLDPELQEIVRKAYGGAINTVFGVMIGVLSLALISSFFIREKRLSK